MTREEERIWVRSDRAVARAVVPFAEPASAAQTLQAGAASKTALVPPMLRRMLSG